MKVLFITPYPKEGPSSRYRVEQFIPYLQEKGCACRVRPFISSTCYKVIYKKGHYFRKIYCLLFGTLRRIVDFILSLKSDIVFIHLEAYPFGPPIFEWLLSIFRKKIIYDLDDAIYMKKTNLLFKILKCSWKIREIIRVSKCVITCNDFLAEYAVKTNKNIYVVHTPIDTDRFAPAKRNDRQELTLGWIGSHSTVAYLKLLNNVLETLSKKYKFILKVIGAGDESISIPGVKIVNINWSLEGEVAELQSFDIGLYPLPEDEWVLGKTGFKTIQYMSVGIPAVASDVGANQMIIADGKNGFRVSTDEEWIDRIGKLIEDRELRRRIGLSGRQTVTEKYSLKISARQIFEIIQTIHRD